MAIYARLENGTYAEVTGVYETDGTEVTEIFQGDRLVYSASNEIYGSLPLYYSGRGFELIDYMIYGNAVQDGTPSADAPVEATGSGVRTGNLVDGLKVTLNTYLTRQGVTGSSTVSNITDYIDIGTLPFVLGGVRTSDIMTSESRALCYYDSNKNYISGTNYDPDVMTRPVSFSNIPQNTKYVRFAFDKAFENGIMLNLGSTALPYEPYGIKLPLTVNGTEYPIYLGTVPTTRRVKKLVLTGEENIVKAATNPVFTMQLSGSSPPLSEIGVSTLSTHYLAQNNVAGTGNVADMCVCIRRGYNTMYIGDTRYDNAADFKTWLAAQYANGTPVTVWYVLAEPETAVVNEPLMKIGDYADTISFAQSQVTIPTVNGANVLDMASPVKPSEMYIKGKGITEST